MFGSPWVAGKKAKTSSPRPLGFRHPNDPPKPLGNLGLGPTLHEKQAATKAAHFRSRERKTRQKYLEVPPVPPPTTPNFASSTMQPTFAWYDYPKAVASTGWRKHPMSAEIPASNELVRARLHASGAWVLGGAPSPVQQNDAIQRGAGDEDSNA